MNHPSRDNPPEPVRVPLTYRALWDDGLGARGWKLDVSIGEEAVIAATAETGTRIPTSVLIHDLLDHHLCGLPIGGHRAEAAALIQLERRTGSDPAPDFAQLVDEDLMRGHCNKEPLRDFLSTWLRRQIPAHTTEEGPAIIDALKESLGYDALRQALVDRFFELGYHYAPEARSEFASKGLDYNQRPELGLALQRVLSRADAAMVAEDVPLAHGVFSITRARCALTLESPVDEHYSEGVAA